MKKFTILILSFLFFIPSISLLAQESYFTYAGGVVGGGLNHIEYKDWFEDERKTKQVRGGFLNCGLLLNIYIRYLVGEISMHYIYNSNDSSPDISVSHLIYNAIGKYAYELDKKILLTSGLGLYLETPPSNIGYDGGAGFILTLGSIYRYNWDWNIIFDLKGRYGSFGIGEDSTKFSWGIDLGLVKRIGKI